MGSYARERGVELLVAVGPLAKGIAAGYGPEAHWFATNEEATAFLQEALRPGDAVLVKGSRGMRTDEIVAALTAGAGSVNPTNKKRLPGWEGAFSVRMYQR